MALDKDSSTFTASCDFCSNYIDTDEDEFLSAVERIKRLGWRVFKQGGEWFHQCEDCQDLGGDFESIL